MPYCKSKYCKVWHVPCVSVMFWIQFIWFEPARTSGYLAGRERSLNSKCYTEETDKTHIFKLCANSYLLLVWSFLSTSFSFLLQGESRQTQYASIVSTHVLPGATKCILCEGEHGFQSFADQLNCSISLTCTLLILSAIFVDTSRICTRYSEILVWFLSLQVWVTSFWRCANLWERGT